MVSSCSLDPGQATRGIVLPIAAFGEILLFRQERKAPDFPADEPVLHPISDFCKGSIRTLADQVYLDLDAKPARANFA